MAEQAMWETTRPTHALSDSAALWLLDGIPPFIPEDVQGVSFTTPDKDWTKQLSKNGGLCAEVFMPVWTLAELREAARALSRLELLEEIDDHELRVFGIDPNELDASMPRPAVLDYRVAIFGGVPRCCCANDRVWLQESFDAELASVRVASAAVEHHFAEHEQATVERKATAFEESIRDVPEMQTMEELSMGVRLFRRCDIGCTAEATKLCGQGDQFLLLDSVQASSIRRITSAFEMTLLHETALQWTALLDHDLPSINSFCWISGSDRVVFFQVTASMNCPVKARGYTRVLKTLGLWNAVQQSPHSVAALVFVVPQWNKSTFKAQSIASGLLVDDASRVVVEQISQYVWAV